MSILNGNPNGPGDATTVADSAWGIYSHYGMKITPEGTNATVTSVGNDPQTQAWVFATY